MKVICDIEADSLGIPDNIWCIVAMDCDSGRTWEFTPANMEDFPSFASKVDVWVGHNFLDYDGPALAHHFNLSFSSENVIDTLVLSRLANPKRTGGHSLENWGKALGSAKIEFDDFSKFSTEMLTYCRQDVILNKKIYDTLTRELAKFSTFSQKLEMKLQDILNNQKRNGFYYDMDQAVKLEAELRTKFDELDSQIKEDFPPELDEVFYPKVNRPDLGYVKGQPVYRYKEFNIGSPRQVQDRLRGHWDPFVKTQGFMRKEMAHHKRRLVSEEELAEAERYGYKVCEENLNTIHDDAPQSAKNIGEYLMLKSRLNLFEQWREAYNPETHRIHGTCISTGASTHRSAHYNPNLGNVIGKKSRYGKEFRQLWTVPSGSYLLGMDAEGIQTRILAELIGDDNYIKLVTEGDVHEYNKSILGSVCKTRDDAKTFIYSWVLGAGIGRTALILGCPLEEAKKARARFVSEIPGLSRLKAVDIPDWASRGAMRLFDGRLVSVPSEHLALAIALQGNEKSIMGLANILWDRWAKEEGIRFRQVNFVHDEWETELPTQEEAQRMGELQQKSLLEAGKLLKLKTPFAGGDILIGRNWYDVH